jgi:hypothetical protein
MALATSARRDQRRRLVASWNRSDSTPDVSDPSPPATGRVAAYDEAAHPERHPGLASRLPTSLGGLVLSAGAILAGMGMAIGLAVSGPLFGRNLLEGGGRFSGTVAVVRQAVHPASPVPLHTWLAVLTLFAASAVAGSIKHMRRHRRDDYKGRFRAWGWLAMIFTLSAWSAIMPLGTLVAKLLSEATGIALGPGGIAWWYAMAAFGLMIVMPWAVLPLRERMGTATWTIAAMLAWSAAAAMPWAQAWVGAADRGEIIAGAAWAGGAAFLLVAMLTAARGVIREVRGDVAPVASSTSGRRDRKRQAAVEQGSEVVADSTDDQPDADEAASEAENDDTTLTDFIDGSGGGERRLSKAERKRLKKLARMNGQAA